MKAPRVIAVSAAAALPVLCVVCADVLAQPVETRFSVGVGSRSDNIDWHTTGDPAHLNPGLQSSVSFDDLNSTTLNFDGEVIWSDKIVMRGHYITGSTNSGDVQQSKFIGGSEVSRLTGSADNSELTDISVALGYQFRLGPQTRLVPMVGYALREQRLEMQDGVQVIDTLGMTSGTGPVLGLDNKYDTEWRGAWLGLHFEHEATERLSLYARGEYHSGDFEVEADENLRPEVKHPRSIYSQANMTGTVLTLGGAYALSGNMRVNAGYNRQDWSTDPGLETTFYADGQEGAATLDEAKWDSNAVFVGIEYVNK
jgi:opacity protein-like surface antigen